MAAEMSAAPSPRGTNLTWRPGPRHTTTAPAKAAKEHHACRSKQDNTQFRTESEPCG